ncbi:MAG TPA: hypothetical protein ENK06_13305 [Gammaproteobacteria bacterium]|nr:hypothetical protein [Gammaproteobacteria bacterium]
MPEEIYQAMLSIATSRPAAVEFLLKENNTWIEDLILKGLIQLSEISTTAHKGNITTEKVEFFPENIRGKYFQTTSDKLLTKAIVQELETKTTPTCLSSYITQ